MQYALPAGPLLSMLDSSIVNVAVEPIARELHASLTTVQWTVSGYLLALGAGLAGPMCRKPGTVSVAPCGGARFCPFCLARPIFTEDPASGEDPGNPGCPDVP